MLKLSLSLFLLFSFLAIAFLIKFGFMFFFVLKAIFVIAILCVACNWLASNIVEMVRSSDGGKK